MTDEVRLVDAGKLIGCLHGETFIDGDDRSIVYKVIEKQSVVKAKPDNDWIPVRDQLPDDKERYLICIGGVRGKRLRTISQ